MRQVIVNIVITFLILTIAGVGFQQVEYWLIVILLFGLGLNNKY